MGPWSVSWSGVRLVAVLELRQRVRSTRWVWLLAGWAALLALLTVLVRISVRRSYLASVDQPELGFTAADTARAQAEAGRVTFAIIAALVLSLGALVAPALTATSVNGDRAAGVLATLQTTLLTPAELALGRLLAAWGVALAFLAVSVPFVVVAFVGGDSSPWRVVVTLALVALTLLVVCAIGLGWSAVAARTATSAVLTYLTVAFLGLGFPLLFALATPLVQETKEVRVTQPTQFDDRGRVAGCATETFTTVETRTERIWWLLAPSPYVVVADALPPVPVQQVASDVYVASDPLTEIRRAVREARLGPAGPVGCEVGAPDPFAAQQAERARAAEGLGAVWPWGLAADVLVGAAFTAVAVARLRTPTRTLPKGTRVA